MITPYSNEGRDQKAGSFWKNLACKLGLQAPNVRTASADEIKIQRLSDGIQTQGQAPVRQGMVRVAGAVTKVSDQGHLSRAVFDGIAAMHQRGEAQLSQAERVKAVDFLSRIADQAEGVKGSVGACGGDAKVADLCGEITAKADAVIGAVTQLRDKAGEMSVAQAEAISNAFLLINDAVNFLGKKGAEAPAGTEGPVMPEIEFMDAGLPESEPEAEVAPAMASPIAGHTPALVRKAMDEAYDDMRCVHTKMLLIESMLNEIIADLNVNTMMTPGMPETGMPPTTELEGPDTVENMREESEDQAAKRDAFDEMEHDHLPASLKGVVRTAASGDPGDSEPGNSVYKDLNKCRDCVWFESDVTHETYRDKCKNCVHAKLDGTINHWWPRSQQMVIWAPQWGAPEALENKVRLSLQDTLSLRQAAPDQAQSIAREIVAAADAQAVDLGEVMVDTFRNPVIASQMGTLARSIVSEIASLTGVTMARDARDGNLIIAYPVIEQVAKGEKGKIRELRTQLDGEKDPVKIKQLHEAIEALHDRVSRDKERKEDRRKQRQEKKDKDQAEYDKQHANIPAKSEAVASIVGTLCLADAMWPSDSPDLGPGESFPPCPKCQKAHAADVPCVDQCPKRAPGQGCYLMPQSDNCQYCGKAYPMPKAQASMVGTLTSRGSL